MRPLAFALFLVAGCAAPPAVVPDAGARDIGGGPDVGGLVDAIVADTALDAGVDARSDLDAPSSDAGALLDVPPDAGLCDIWPDSCADGYACRYQAEGGVRTGRACERAGTDDDGDSCETYADGDSCLPGYFCSGLLCRRMCRTDADCPPLGGNDRYCGSGGTAGNWCQRVP